MIWLIFFRGGLLPCRTVVGGVLSSIQWQLPTIMLMNIYRRRNRFPAWKVFLARKIIFHWQFKLQLSDEPKRPRIPWRLISVCLLNDSDGSKSRLVVALTCESISLSRSEFILKLVILSIKYFFFFTLKLTERKEEQISKKIRTLTTPAIISGLLDFTC